MGPGVVLVGKHLVPSCPEVTGCFKFEPKLGLHSGNRPYSTSKEMLSQVHPELVLRRKLLEYMQSSDSELLLLA